MTRDSLVRNWSHMSEGVSATRLGGVMNICKVRIPSPFVHFLHMTLSFCKELISTLSSIDPPTSPLSLRRAPFLPQGLFDPQVKSYVREGLVIWLQQRRQKPITVSLASDLHRIQTSGSLGRRLLSTVLIRPS